MIIFKDNSITTLINAPLSIGIYPIEGFASPDRSIGNDPSWNKKYKSAFDYMSDEAKKYLKNNTLRLYYGFLQEDKELKFLV